MIRSFANDLAKAVFERRKLSKKLRHQAGELNLLKAAERLDLLDEAYEKSLLTAPSLHYHSLSGSNRYSIDADSRNSKWRITFEWENEEMKNVELVKIEDTH